MTVLPGRKLGTECLSSTAQILPWPRILFAPHHCCEVRIPTVTDLAVILRCWRGLCVRIEDGMHLLVGEGETVLLVPLEKREHSGGRLF
jgi:hypothetical protein